VKDAAMSETFAGLPRLVALHLELTLFALLVGIALSVPLGILSARSRVLSPLILGVAGVAQTIPSLALLALMVPCLAALGAPSIGFLPAFIALVVYSMLPVLRNTVTGFADIDRALIEAARGVGMTPLQILYYVELPTALPVIAAGIRTATVWTVGAATLATPVGAQSLGNYIFTGLQTRNVGLVLVGCVSAALLALLLDGLARLLALGLERPRRNAFRLGLIAVICLYGFAGWTAVDEHRQAGSKIVIGTKTFTEQYILAEALSGYLKSAGRKVQITSSLGSSVLFDGLSAGTIDVGVDYSGTIWSTVLKRGDVPRDRESALREIGTALAAHHGITVVAALGFENSYAIAVRRSVASALHLKNLSDLAAHADDLAIAADYEFFARPEWLALRARYGFTFREQRAMDPSLVYDAARNGTVDVISAFSTDGRLSAFDLPVLEDDRRVMPRYDAILLSSTAFARQNPTVIGELASLSGSLDVSQMRALNKLVDQDGRDPSVAAAPLLKRWLAHVGAM
jgi:osmoprotectant transport system permease protein